MANLAHPVSGGEACDVQYTAASATQNQLLSHISLDIYLLSSVRSSLWENTVAPFSSTPHLYRLTDRGRHIEETRKSDLEFRI